MGWWYYALVWTLQIGAIALFHLSYRNRTRQLRICSKALFEAHELLLKARDVLRDHSEHFDAKYTALQVQQHLEDTWERAGVTEATFRKLVREVQQCQNSQET